MVMLGIAGCGVVGLLRETNQIKRQVSKNDDYDSFTNATTTFSKVLSSDFLIHVFVRIGEQGLSFIFIVDKTSRLV